MKDSSLSLTRRALFKDLLVAGATVGSVRQAYSSAGLQTNPAPIKSGSADWPRFGYDLHNTRFNSKETQLGRENVGQLKLKWKFETDAPIQIFEEGSAGQ